MHVVVTGAAGFIGSHACERLCHSGHRVTALDAFDDYLYASGPKRETARELAKLPRFELVEGDICDPAVVARVIREDVDVVLHLAALAGVRPSMVAPQRYVRTNVEGTTVILERMRALGLTRLVFASSSSVYGARPAASDAFREDEPCITPASPYAATKRMGELMLSAYRDLYGIGSFALRFFTVYGPRQRPDMAIAKFTSAIARGEPITLFGDGSSRRDYTFIDDIVSGTIGAVERVAPAQCEIVNLGNTSTVSLAELVAIIERVVGKTAVVERQRDQPGDVPLTYANIDRARSLLGYAPTTKIESGVARYWKWMQR